MLASCFVNPKGECIRQNREYLGGQIHYSQDGLKAHRSRNFGEVRI
jgi:hypothetical protein